jgi:hypothetical protein
MGRFVLGVSASNEPNTVMVLARELHTTALYKKLEFLITHSPKEIGQIYDHIIPTSLVPLGEALAYPSWWELSKSHAL